MKAKSTYLKNKEKEKTNYELVEKEFLQHYKFNRFQGKWHINVDMDNRSLGSIIIPDYLDSLVHALKKTNQFIHINLQKFIEEIQLHMQQHIDDYRQPTSWRMEGDIFIHALKEIILLREEVDVTIRMSAPFSDFYEIYDDINTINALKFNPNPTFTFKLIST